MTKKPLRVGFDLDGVLVYNPARIARLPVTIIKKLFLPSREKTFFIPTTDLQKFIFRLFHLSSIFIAPGLSTIKQLAQDNDIELYIITARFDFLKDDFFAWLKRMGIRPVLKKAYYNKDNQQPHIYKEKLVKKLELDYFVEDNFDIVDHLTKTTKAKVLWIYNILETGKAYPYKFPSLQKAVEYLSGKARGNIAISRRAILMCSEFAPPHWTGIVKSYMTLATSLLAQGHSVTILTTRYDSTLKRKDIYEGIPIQREDPLFQISRTQYSLQTLLAAPGLFEQVDTVSITTPHSNVLPLSLLAKIMGKKLHLYHQGDLTLPKKTGNQLAHRILELVFDLMTIPAMQMADVVSTYTRDYAAHSRVMRHFLYKFKPYIPKLTLDSQPPQKIFKQNIDLLKKTSALVGFAGRFVEEKGFDILLQAIPHVLKERPDAHFLFAGDTHISYEPFFEQVQDLIEKSKENITLLGLLDGPELAYFYKSLDLFALSSRSDCFPLTQMEAVRAGVPVVATNIPGARMLVKETGCGIIVPPENVKKLANAIITVLNNPDNYRKKTKDAVQWLDSYALPTID